MSSHRPEVSGERDEVRVRGSAQVGSQAGKEEYEKAHAHAHAHEKEKEKGREEEQENEGAFERSELAFGFDLLGALDSDDIEWLQQEEARRAKEARRCAHCGTTFHPVSPYAEECPSLARHERRCAKATPGERAFYAEHRRWPRSGQLDSGADEAA